MRRRLELIMALLFVSTLCGCTQKTNEGKSNETVQMTTQVTEVGSESGGKISTEQASENVKVEESETTENNSTQSQDDAEEITVIEIEPDKKMDYKGKEILMSLESNDEFDGGNIVLEYGDAKYKLNEYTEWITTGYLIEIDDTIFYTILQACYSNDWVTSYIVKYDGNTFVDIAEQIGGIADVSSITKNQITFETRVDLFGTYGITIPMKLENDKLISLDTVIKFVNNPDPSIFDEFESLDADTKERIAKEYNEEGYRVLTLKKNLKSKSENGDLEIKAGEQIIPYGYDEKAQKFYFTYDDTLCYFEYESKDDGYTLTINGVDQEDMFEALPYVG